MLAVVTTIVAPLGTWLAQVVAARRLWVSYFGAVAYLAWRMFLPENSEEESQQKIPGRKSGEV